MKLANMAANARNRIHNFDGPRLIRSHATGNTVTVMQWAIAKLSSRRGDNSLSRGPLAWVAGGACFRWPLRLLLASLGVLNGRHRQLVEKMFLLGGPVAVMIGQRLKQLVPG